MVPTSAHATCSERTPLARQMIMNVWTAMAYQWMQAIFSQRTTIAERNETLHAPAYSIQASASPDAALALEGKDTVRLAYLHLPPLSYGPCAVQTLPIRTLPSWSHLTSSVGPIACIKSATKSDSFERNGQSAPNPTLTL
jgi:hypothetical protein